MQEVYEPPSECIAVLTASHVIARLWEGTSWLMHCRRAAQAKEPLAAGATQTTPEGSPKAHEASVLSSVTTLILGICSLAGWGVSVDFLILICQEFRPLVLRCSRAVTADERSKQLEGHESQQ